MADQVRWPTEQDHPFRAGILPNNCDICGEERRFHPPPPPKPPNYQETLDSIVAAFRIFAVHASVVSDADLKATREALSRAQSIGFAVDPTKYREALFSGSLERQDKLLNLFADVRQRLEELFPDVQLIREGSGQ